MGTDQHSLNQIIQYLAGLAARDQRINSFGYGPIYDVSQGPYFNIENNSGQINYTTDVNLRPTYPLMWVEPQQSELRKDSLILKHKLHFVDLVNKNTDNRLDIMSDTLRTAMEIKAFIFKDFSTYAEDIFPTDTSGIKPVFEQFDDEVSGHVMDLDLQMDWLANVCDIPGLYPSGVTFVSGPGYYNVAGSGYLPLTGGILSGPLSGTSADFAYLFSAGTNLYDIFATVNETGKTGVQLWTASTGVYSIVPAQNATTYYTNIAPGQYSFIGGGQGNYNYSFAGAIAAGRFNVIKSPSPNFIGGGNSNSATSYYTSVLNGVFNLASNSYSTVIAGNKNIASGILSTVVSGYRNINEGSNAFLGSGIYNSITNNSGIIGQASQSTFLGGGYGNTIQGDFTNIVSGKNNKAYSPYSSILGGKNNTILSSHTDVFIVGSNITANQNNATFTENARLAETNGTHIYSAGTPLEQIFLLNGQGFNQTGVTNAITYWSSPTTLGSSMISQGTSGITLNGSVEIYGNVEINGTATTFNTTTVQTKDNNITMNLSGSHVSALYGGITVLSGTPNGASSTWNIDANGAWSANTLIQTSAITVNGGLIISGSTDLSNLFLSTATTFVQSVGQGTNIITGGTASNPIINTTSNPIFSTLSATSISATTFYSGSTDLSLLFGTGGASTGGFSGWTASTGANSIIANNGTNNAGTAPFAFVGGKGNRTSSTYTTIVGGLNNTANTQSFAFIGNGTLNFTTGQKSFIGNGTSNSAQTGLYSTIVNGQGNKVLIVKGFIGNGLSNSALTSAYATVLNGKLNASTGIMSVVVNGSANTSTGAYSFIGGGQNNKSPGKFTFIGDGFKNLTNTNFTYQSIGNGKSNYVAAGYGFIGNGSGNTVQGQFGFIGNGKGNYIGNGQAAIVSGYKNKNLGVYSIIGAGKNNYIAGYLGSAIVGGNSHTVISNYSTIAGGHNNTISGTSNYSTASFIGGGTSNLINSKYATINGGRGNLITGTTSNYATVFGGRNNKAGGQYSIVGGYKNITNASFTTIVGGGRNTVSSQYGVIVGGTTNTISSPKGVVIGGVQNSANTNSYGTIIGGVRNVTTGTYGTIINGQRNMATGKYSTVLNGTFNTANTFFSTVLGSSGSTVLGSGSTIIGGNNNVLTGFNSAIIGGSFVSGTSNNTVYVPNARLAETVGTTIFSAGTPLEQIFAPLLSGTTSGVLSIGQGSNIITGGTASKPIINSVDTYLTAGTYSNGTITFSNNTGQTFTVTGLSTANTFTGVYITGGTYASGTTTLFNSTGGTSLISGYTYNVPFVTAFTYSNNAFIISNATGGTMTAVINSVTGLTSTGTISSNILSGTSVVGNGSGLTGILNTYVTGGTYNNNAGLITFTNNTGVTFTVSGLTTGGTSVINGLNTYTAGTIFAQSVNISAATLSSLSVSGSSNFTSGLTANTFSAGTLYSGATNLYGIFTTSATSLVKTFKDVTQSSGITGTLTSTAAKSILIPGNTFTAGDTIYIGTKIAKTGTGGNTTQRQYIYTANTLTSATLIATQGPTATNWMSMVRTPFIRSGNTTIITSPTTSIINDEDSTVAAAQSILTSIDWTLPQYFMVAIQNASTADTTTVQYVEIIKK